MTERAIAQGLYNTDYQGIKMLPGYHPSSNRITKHYHDIIKECRHFYKNDPIASTVVNRMVDIAVTAVRHRKRGTRNVTPSDDATTAYFNAIAPKLRTFLKAMAVDYLLYGVSIPEWSFNKIRGDLLAEALGRKKVIYPAHLWTRNIDLIRLYKRPFGDERTITMLIPPEDVSFIKSKGKLPNGATDTKTYNELLEKFPAYVAAIESGQTEFMLEDALPIYRKLGACDTYPTPYLQPALAAMQHKVDLKLMDRSIAARAIQSFRHIKIGTDALPATAQDIEAAKASLNVSNEEAIFNWITPHIYSAEWVYPPIEVLVNDAKYAEPNADIFLALGFPRILVSGETLRSNSSDASVALLGPKATLSDLRDVLIEWLIRFYDLLAQENGFVRTPEPYFSPIQTGDLTSLVQFAVQAMQSGAISKDTLAQLYDTSWDTESLQIVEEQNSGVLSPTERAAQILFQQQQQLGGQKLGEDTGNTPQGNTKEGDNAKET